MIMYNVTVKVDLAIANAWVKWLIDEHIPEVIATGCFSGARTLKMIDVDDSEGETYTVQYTAESKADYNKYIAQFATQMRDKSFEKWGNQFIAFRTVMQVIH